MVSCIKGAVAVVTLNLQKGVPAEVQIPDAWHHQMVYGVGPKGIALLSKNQVKHLIAINLSCGKILLLGVVKQIKMVFLIANAFFVYLVRISKVFKNFRYVLCRS